MGHRDSQSLAIPFGRCVLWAEGLGVLSMKRWPGQLLRFE
jgi:hypothetical protein